MSVLDRLYWRRYERQYDVPGVAGTLDDFRRRSARRRPTAARDAPARSGCGISRRGPTRCRNGATRRAIDDLDALWDAWPSLPILTKADLRERFSARALRAQGVEGQVSATGGSTGEPTTFIHDAASVRRIERDHARGAAGARLAAGHADDLRVGRPARHRPGPHRLSTRAPRPHQPAVAAARGRRLRADRRDRAPRPRPAPREPRRRRHLRLQLDARSRRARGAGARLAGPRRSRPRRVERRRDAARRAGGPLPRRVRRADPQLLRRPRARHDRGAARGGWSVAPRPTLCVRRAHRRRWRSGRAGPARTRGRHEHRGTGHAVPPLRHRRRRHV